MDVYCKIKNTLVWDVTPCTVSEFEDILEESAASKSAVHPSGVSRKFL